jgi:hypothetical protein
MPDMLLQSQDAAHTLIDALFGERSIFHSLDHGIEGFNEV